MVDVLSGVIMVLKNMVLEMGPACTSSGFENSLYHSQRQVDADSLVWDWFGCQGSKLLCT